MEASSTKGRGDFLLRPIEASDNAAMARVIRTVMTEHDAVGPGYSINDAEVDDMAGNYREPTAIYYVLIETASGAVVGGGGIGPLQGAGPEVCELKKMYFLPQARGLGWGRALLELCLAAAKKRGYAVCYLETLRSMTTARKLYARRGFTERSRPLGATGHCVCDAWYELAL